MDPKPSASSCETIGASWTSLQRLCGPKQWRSLHGHCGYGRKREVMGLSKLEGGFAVLELPRWQRYRCVESTGISCRRVWRYRQRTWDFSAVSTYITNILRLVQVYSPPSIRIAHPAPSSPPLYLTHPQPAKPYTSLSFCPFHDALAIGHAAGVSCILVPGVGEPNFDSSEADPFEGSKARREREVKSLLDKVLSSFPFPPSGEDIQQGRHAHWSFRSNQT
jgi:hypothetical protein